MICGEWENNRISFFNWCFNNGWIEGARFGRYDERKPHSPKNTYLLPSVENILSDQNRYRGTILSKEDQEDINKMLLQGVLRVMIAEKYKITLQAVQFFEDNLSKRS